MRGIVVSTVVAIALAAAVGARAEPRLPEKVQTALESWLAERAPIEKATGIAAFVSLGDRSGDRGLRRQGRPGAK